MTNKAIATAPGEETIYVPLTEGELAQRQVDEAAFQEAVNTDQRTLLERLSGMVDALSDEVQAALSQAITGAYVALSNNRPNVAKIIVQNATIPPELEPLREAILAEFAAAEQ